MAKTSVCCGCLTEHLSSRPPTRSTAAKTRRRIFKPNRRGALTEGEENIKYEPAFCPFETLRHLPLRLALTVPPTGCRSWKTRSWRLATALSPPVNPVRAPPRWGRSCLPEAESTAYWAGRRLPHCGSLVETVA